MKSRLVLRTGVTHISYIMDGPSAKRPKKSDKAKEKAGRPSSRHVRAYEALMEKPKEVPKKTK